MVRMATGSLERCRGLAAVRHTSKGGRVFSGSAWKRGAINGGVLTDLTAAPPEARRQDRTRRPHAIAAT